MKRDPEIDPDVSQRIPPPILRTDAVCEAIREMVVSGRFTPGERLRQLHLAATLGVDQRTVREALGLLVNEGLLAHEAYKGVRVALLPVEELEDVYGMRAALEALAMEVAATRISTGDLDRMRELLPRTWVSPGSPSIEAVREANREFHWVPILASGRRHLIRSLKQLWYLITTYVLASNVDEHERAQSSREDQDEHTAILDALVARDGALAGRLSMEHAQSNWRTMYARLERQGWMVHGDR